MIGGRSATGDKPRNEPVALPDFGGDAIVHQGAGMADRVIVV